MLTLDTRLRLLSANRQYEGDEIILGRPDTGVFIAIPSEAGTILDLIASGSTLGEIESFYRHNYGDDESSIPFIEGLIQRGLVAPTDVIAAPSSEIATNSVIDRLSRALFSRTVLCLHSLLILAAGVTVAIVPSILPDTGSLYFQDHRALKTVLVLGIAYLSIFFHEMAHLLAARSVGVRGRLGISHRLWFVVAETDLTGLWAVPRRLRYMPILAGPLVDLSSACALLLLLYLDQVSVLYLRTDIRQIVSASIFVYFLRIIWQCYFFLRTDFYYLIATLTGCKNLMGDTERWLGEKFLRPSPLKAAPMPWYISDRELRVVRVYAVLWVTGHAASFVTLVLVTLPLAKEYLWSMFNALRSGRIEESIDPLVTSLAFLVPLAVGMALWLHSIKKKIRSLS
jgi:putative peptide zinc metalloprotease protein